MSIFARRRLRSISTCTLHRRPRLEALGDRVVPAAGTLDAGFGNDGEFVTSVGGDLDIANAVAMQGKRRLVVAGSTFSGTDNDFALVRYRRDGSLDLAFGGDGKVITPIGGNDTAVAVQDDARIIAAGYSFNGADNDFALVRYLPDGELDPSFGIGGKVITHFGGDDVAQGVVIQADGKIVVAGYSSNGSTSDFALARYNPDGSLDSSFGGEGKVTTDIAGD